MVRKFTFLLGFGAGYLLGARAGRERYRQVVDKADQIWHEPHVQQAAQKGAHAARNAVETVSATVSAKVAGTADRDTDPEGNDGERSPVTE